MIEMFSDYVKYFPILVIAYYMPNSTLQLFALCTLIIWVTYETIFYYKSLPPGEWSQKSKNHFKIVKLMKMLIMHVYKNPKNAKVATSILIWMIYISGPWGVPMLGYLPFMSNKPPHKLYLDMSARYGDVFSLKLGSNLIVGLGSAKLMRDLFNRPDSTARPKTPLNSLLGGLGKYLIIWLKY